MVSFIHALRTYPLREAIEVYWKNIMIPLIYENTHDKLTIEECSLQIDDWVWTWDKDHACHCRSRGGSKTFDFVHYIIFRVLRTQEKWAWLAAKSGQLTQSMLYVQQNPLFKQMYVLTVGNARRHFVELHSGDRILWGIISTSCLGLRMDGIICDEEEDMQLKQSEEVYPQLEGMMTVSKTGQFLHLGTLWIATRFNDNTEYYPTKIRSWDTLPWLANSPKMQKIIDNPKIPEWEKNLLYRCIPSSPGGMFFPCVILEDLSHHRVTTAIQNGLDYGATDHCVGIEIVGMHCYVLEEFELDIEKYPHSVDFLKGRKVESEGGGYNVDSRYSAKGLLVKNRVSASLVPITQKWKDQRKMYGRQLIIHCDTNRTPGTTRDIKGATFGPDGYYLKDDAHPCHWLDAFFHALKANITSYLPSPPRSRRHSIIEAEKAREMRSLY